MRRLQIHTVFFMIGFLGYSASVLAGADSTQPGFVLPTVPEPNPESLLDQRSLLIQHIVLEGNTLFPEQDLRSIVQPYEGRVVSVAELERLRQQLVHYYIDHGYVNSGVVIPNGALHDGELHFHVIEGKIENIQLKGMERLREGYVKNRLWSDPHKPFRLQELQENFQLLLSDPLISTMKGSILPGEDPGHCVLDVEVVRANPYQLRLFANNQRPPSVGSIGYGFTGSVQNVTGLGDQINITLINSQGTNEYTGGITVPITDANTTLFFRFDEGDSSVIEEPLQTLAIKSTVNNVEGGIRYPLVRTLEREFALGVSLALRKNKTTLLGQPFSFVPGNASGQTQVSVLQLFQEYTQRWEHTALSLNSSLHVGMDAWGATTAIAPQYPGSQFLSWIGQAQVAHKLSDRGTQWLVRSTVQRSDSPLLPQERMAVGGFSTVRGYRENQLVRDQGCTFSMELHYPLFGGTDPHEKQHLTLIPFVDYGTAWNHKEAATTLSSVGLGFDWQFNRLHAELYYGHALKTMDPQQHRDLQDEGIHFQVRLDLL